MNISKQNFLISLCLTALISISTPLYAGSHEHDNTTATSTIKIVQTKAVLRDLWLDHAFWIRNVVIGTISGNDAIVKAAEDQVVSNAKLISASIQPFYGQAASDKLFSLLAEHYNGINNYLKAVSSGQANKDLIVKAINKNVEDITVFLSGANPYLPQDAVRGLLLAHVGHHMQQIEQLINKQYQQETKTWEDMKNHMYSIADALTGALAKQFPAKFK